MGVSNDTLRRWDKSGELKPTKKDQKTGYRYYGEEDVYNYLKNLDIFKIASLWVRPEQKDEPQKLFYCASNDVFRARLERFRNELYKDLNSNEVCSLVGLIIGEIGNNSFDHNIGNWPDIPGIFFGYSLRDKKIALADRGLGILKTLSRVRPGLDSSKDAVRTAFTEIISGRAPEARGNGLKAVRNIVTKYNMQLVFQSGNARLRLRRGDRELKLRELKKSIKGCLALIEYDY